MLGLNLVMVMIHARLQLVLSKTNRIRDTTHAVDN